MKIRGLWYRCSVSLLNKPLSLSLSLPPGDIDGVGEVNVVRQRLSRLETNFPASG